MAFWETVFTIILLLFAARVCSTSQPAQEWMHHDQQTSLEVTLINALHTDKTNQEQLSSYFCTPQLLLNVSFLVAIAPQHIRTKRINWQEDEYLSDETRSYSFLITTSPLLKAVHPQFFCLLQPQLLFSKQLWSEPCFNPPKIELSLYVQYMAAPILDQDIQTALKRMLQKVPTFARCIHLTTEEQEERQWQYDILPGPPTHQTKFHFLFLVLVVLFFETCLLLQLVISLACFSLNLSVKAGRLVRSASYIVGAWNAAIIAGGVTLNNETVIVFKLLICSFGFFVVYFVSYLFRTDNLLRKITSTLFVWNFVVFAQYMMFLSVTFLPQMTVNFFPAAFAVFLRYLPVIVSILTHYVFVHYLSSYYPHCKCLLIIAEIFLSVFPLYLLLIIVSLLDIAF